MTALSRSLERGAAVLSRRWIRWVGYPAYFSFCLIAFGYFTFPYERVRERVRTEMEAALSADVEIEDLTPSWVTGVELSGVDIETRPRKQGEKGSRFRVDSVTARVSLLSLLVGDLDVSFGADLLGGEIEGSASQDGEATHVTLAWSGLDLSQVVLVREAIGLPVSGTLEGEADLKAPGGLLASSEGRISIAGDALAVGDGTSKLQLPGMPGDGITVDAIRVGTLRGELRVTEGSAEIQRMSSTSSDLEMVWEGNLRLQDPFPRSRVTAYVRFEFGDAYRNRSDRTKALFEMLELVPRMKQAKRPDGFYGYRVGGSFDRGLTFTPSTRAAPGARPPRERPARPKRLPRRGGRQEEAEPNVEEESGGLVGPPDEEGQ